MSLKIVQEGLTENPLSVPMSASSLNSETQSFIEGGGGGGGDMGCALFLFSIHSEAIVLATSKFKDLSCWCSDTEMRAALKATEIILT